MKFIFIILLVLLFSSCYWTPMGAQTYFGLIKNPNYAEEEIEEETTTVNITITWSSEK